MKGLWSRWKVGLAHQGGLLIAIAYMLLGGAWIYFSDDLAARLAPDPSLFHAISTYKGWVYVLVTTFLLYLLIDANNRALRRMNNHYHLLSENITDVLTIADVTDPHLTYVSPSVVQMFGFTPEEAQAQHLETLIPHSSWQHLVAILPERIHEFETGKAMTYRDEIELFRKDGQLIWVEVNSRFVRNPRNRHTELYVTLRDMTERRRADTALRESEANLRESEEKYRALAEALEQRVQERTAEVEDLYNHAPCGYHSVDEEGRFVHINDTELEWLGYTREELLGRHIREIITPETLPVFDANFQLFKQRGWVKGLEYDFRRKDGSTFPVMVSATAIMDADGKYLLSRSTIFDITEMKRAQEALRSSQERLNFLLAHTPAVIFTAGLDEDVPMTFISDSVTGILGYQPEQYLEQRGFWLSRVHPTDIEPGMKALEKLRVDGQVVWQCRVLGADGMYRWMATGMTLLRDSQGRPQEFIGYTVNIDDQMKAESALRDSEMQNRLLFEESPDAVVLVDYDSKILRANRAYEELTMRPREMLIGQNPVELGIVSASQYAEVLKAVTTSNIRQETYASADYLLTCADGTTRSIECRVYRMVLNGQKCVMITNRDISVRKQAEEQLRLANTEMENAMRLRDEFLASMSHELRTPLTGIMGMSEALQDQIYGQLNERQLRALGNIQTSSQHLLDLINDILDVSKLEAGKLTLQVDACSLSQVCRASVQLIKGMAQKKGQQISLNMHPDEIWLMADGRRLKQVLVNLLSNAVKYSPEGGSLGLDVVGDETERTIQLSVWDQGIGIRPEDMDKLFKPFVQLDSSLSRQQSGTGLGLMLVQHLTDLHGGSISVDSTPGQGSRFTVLLPWNLPQAASAGPDEAESFLPVSINEVSEMAHLSASADGGPLVMLVDDNEINLSTIWDYLTSKKFRVVTARNGIDFLNQVCALRPEIVLLDMQMPGMDGLEVVKQLRRISDPEIAALPVIAITALSMPQDRERCLAAGASEYINKPIQLSHLVKTINRLLA